MPFVTTRDGTRLFCRRWGAGPPVVFLHGWAMSSEVWLSAMTLTAQAGFEAIAFDRRGHGRSDDPGRGYDYDTLADDLADVLDALGLRGATLVTHSMNAGESVRYLGRHGDGRVARLVLAAPSLPYQLKCDDNPDGPVDGAAAEQWRTIWAVNWTEWLGQAVPAAYGPAASPDRVQQSLRMMLACSPYAAIEVHKAVVDTDFRAELPRIATPTLILHGDADQSCPLEATGRRAAALMPAARLKIYPGANHTFVGGSAGEIVADVTAFIAETARSAAA